ncbi:hypothetical protein N7486_010755 [Penicillium sp. IBT 16267x]|nr:hypothetical protein N7486_010755 [Penicillium sp. IBT 16267x]
MVQQLAATQWVKWEKWDVLVNMEVNVQRGRGCSRRANDDAGISNIDIPNFQLLPQLAFGIVV